MNAVNSTALFRSLIVYAICVPLAIVVGYTLVNVTNYWDYQSLGLIAALIAFLIFPLLMKWHYPLLIFSWSCPLYLFFLPGRPQLFMFMAAASLTISVVERILDKNKQFVTSSAFGWPLITLLGVVVLTAELTGGIGFHAMGSETYGGKKYAGMIIGTLSYFAITARAIPEKSANWYVFLFFIGGFFNLISDFYAVTPEKLRFVYLLFPGMVRSYDSMGNAALELGVTRMFGISVTAGSVFLWMLARYGIRGIFISGKLWRPLVLVVSFVLILTGGFRSSILVAAGVFAVLFFLEKMHRSILLLPFLLIGITVGVALVPLAPHLPYTFQRSIAFLPLNIDPAVKLDAEGSTQWRLDMWTELLPEIPKYLLLGKGFAFSAQTYNEFMGANATFKSGLGASEDPLALSSDFHSGPLSVLIPFGIWGALAWLWCLAAGFWVMRRNYLYGSSALRHANVMLYTYFLVKLLTFFFIFGGITDDVAGFGGIVGLSIALNHGVRRPVPPPQVNPAFTNPRQNLPPRPAFQR